jgi:hypothetical protein
MPAPPPAVDLLLEALKPEAGKTDRAQMLTSFLIVAYSPPETFEDTDQMTDDRAQQARKSAERPEMRIISRAGEELAADALTITDYQHWGCNDYTIFATVELDDPLVPYTDRNYVILSPRDLVLVMPRDRRDHVEWLVDRTRYEEALKEAEEIEAQERMAVVKSDEVEKTKIHLTAQDIGQKYVEHLVSEGMSFTLLRSVVKPRTISTGNFVKAAQLSPKVCAHDSKRWENWIFAFAQQRQLQVGSPVYLPPVSKFLQPCQTIIPYVPTDNPRLDHVVYEMMLAHFLTHDRKVGGLVSFDM